MQNLHFVTCFERMEIHSQKSAWRFRKIISPVDIDTKPIATGQRVFVAEDSLDWIKDCFIRMYQNGHVLLPDRGVVLGYGYPYPVQSREDISVPGMQVHPPATPSWARRGSLSPHLCTNMHSPHVISLLPLWWRYFNIDQAVQGLKRTYK